MNVPFVDLKAQYASIKTEVGPAMNEVLEACSFIMGPQVTRFEEEFARYNGTRYCVGVESGTAALKLALEAIGVGPGDEVILPANTYIASAIAVSAVGAIPVFVDHDDYYLIDATAIEAAITPRTKAIIPVHLYGQMVPMQPILDIAKRHGVRVVEDAAQSHGARWEGHRAGSVGDVGCFSFYPGKNLGCYGDGGAIVTNDESVADRVRLLRDFGQKRKYEHEIKGDKKNTIACSAPPASTFRSGSPTKGTSIICTSCKSTIARPSCNVSQSWACRAASTIRFRFICKKRTPTSMCRADRFREPNETPNAFFPYRCLRK